MIPTFPSCLGRNLSMAISPSEDSTRARGLTHLTFCGGKPGIHASTSDGIVSTTLPKKIYLCLYVRGI